MKVYIAENDCCAELPDLPQLYGGLIDWEEDVSDLIGYFGGFNFFHPNFVDVNEELRMLSFATEEDFDIWSEDIRGFIDLNGRVYELLGEYGSEKVWEVIDPYVDILYGNDFEAPTHGGDHVYLCDFVVWLNQDLDKAFNPMNTRFEFAADEIESADMDVVLALTIDNERPLSDRVHEYAFIYAGEAVPEGICISLRVIYTCESPIPAAVSVTVTKSAC